MTIIEISKAAHIRMREVFREFIDGDDWSLMNSPAEFLTDYIICVCNIGLSNKYQSNDGRIKAEKYRFIRKTMIRYRKLLYDSGGKRVPLNLEEDLNTSWKMFGEMYVSLLDVFPIRYGENWKPPLYETND